MQILANKKILQFRSNRPQNLTCAFLQFIYWPQSNVLVFQSILQQIRLQIQMLRPIFFTLSILLLLGTCESRYLHKVHHNSPLPPSELNKLTNNIIKNKIAQNRQLFSNQTFATSLINDLYQTDDSKRTLTSIDRNSAYELLALFGIKGSTVCGLDKLQALSGPNLSCLNKIFETVKANPSQLA